MLSIGVVFFVVAFVQANGDPHTTEPPATVGYGGERGAISSGGCRETASVITIGEGNYSTFTSPNYPENYNTSSKCNWKFKSSDSTPLRLTCTPVKLSCFSSFKYSDGNTSKEISCVFCSGDSSFTHDFAANSTAEINFGSFFLFTNKGFSCRIEQATKKRCSCGMVGTGKIVGGTEVNKFDYGWMAILQRKRDAFFFCGGYLVTPTFVVTAAHCIKTSFTTQVRLGVHDKGNKPSTEITRDVLKATKHPSYSARFFNYDIGILEIASVDINNIPQISTICLPTGKLNYEGVVSTAAGWGKISPSGSTSNVLLEVNVTVISKAECKKRMSPFEIFITDQMVCTLGNGNGVCPADSGGPLFHPVKSASNVVYQEAIGVVSWGFGCPSSINKFPQMFARVTEMVSWVRENIEGEGLCPPPA